MVDVQVSSGASLIETNEAQEHNFDAGESPNTVTRFSSTVDESNTDGWVTTTDANIYDSTFKIDLETSLDVVREDGTSTLGRLDSDSILMDGESISKSNIIDTYYVARQLNAETEGLHHTVWESTIDTLHEATLENDFKTTEDALVGNFVEVTSSLGTLDSDATLNDGQDSSSQALSDSDYSTQDFDSDDENSDDSNVGNTNDLQTTVSSVDESTLKTSWETTLHDDLEHLEDEDTSSLDTLPAEEFETTTHSGTFK